MSHLFEFFYIERGQEGCVCKGCRRTNQELERRIWADLKQGMWESAGGPASQGGQLAGAKVMQEKGMDAAMFTEQRYSRRARTDS